MRVRALSTRLLTNHSAPLTRFSRSERVLTTFQRIIFVGKIWYSFSDSRSAENVRSPFPYSLPYSRRLPRLPRLNWSLRISRTMLAKYCSVSRPVFRDSLFIGELHKELGETTAQQVPAYYSFRKSKWRKCILLHVREIATGGINCESGDGRYDSRCLRFDIYVNDRIQIRLHQIRLVCVGWQRGTSFEIFEWYESNRYSGYIAPTKISKELFTSTGVGISKI